MRTLRRLYFYVVAFISLEVVLWGLIGLARSIFAPAHVVSNSAERLAQALALLLVGVPVFAFHWRMAERFARRDPEEHASGVRAIFFHGILLATLIPIVQNGLSLLNRLLLAAFRFSPTEAILGSYQTWSDNLIAMIMNALIASYFILILRADWTTVTPKVAFADVRRIYRYIWVLYGLMMTVAGIQQILHFLLDFSQKIVGVSHWVGGINTIALLLVGTPVWFYAWKTVQDSLTEQAERESSLRLGVLYLLSLGGVITVLTTGSIVIDVFLRFIFGESMTFARFIQLTTIPLSLGISLGIVWAYHGYWLDQSITCTPDAPRRAGMRRLYYYILAAIGLGATFVGLSMLLSYMVNGLFYKILLTDTLRSRLAAALATLAASLPLWGLTWWPMQSEALAVGETGDHARRSLVRKIFIYLALFASVIGGMIMAGMLANVILLALLGQTPHDFLQTVLLRLKDLLLFMLLGVYHGSILGTDNKRASEVLAGKHAAFQVLVFDPGDGVFAQTLLAALQKQTPNLPAVIQPADKPASKGANVRAVILPADLALDPPEQLRRWLAKFSGHRLVVPRPAAGWTWTGGVRPLPAAASQAALAVRQLAEGQEIRLQGGTSGWMIVVYILAGLSGLEILMGLISLAASLFIR